MHWFEGSIAEAVTLSKQRNSIFVVFVEGDNDLSTEMAVTIDDSAVVDRLSNAEHFLAVKLKSGSPNYTHFAQIYQFVPVPSLFFIGRNGTPLEVVCAGVQPANLATRIDRILEEHLKEKPGDSPEEVKPESDRRAVEVVQEEIKKVEPAHRKQVQPETSSGPPTKIQKTFHQITKSGKEYDVVCDGDVCTRVQKVRPGEPGPSHAGLADDQNQPQIPETESASSMEKRMEMAKELIEARKREKEAKEKEAEKQKELERRSVGQGVAELKKWQAEQEFKQIQDERKREKLENEQARQRILEQIAQDRAERRARDVTPTPPPPAAPTAPAASQAPGDTSTRARIQFKLPDGSMHTAHFEADGTLAQVQCYVAENLSMTPSSFSLWTAFPRRELTDCEATLRRLQLSPSAALLVLPRRDRAVSTSPSAVLAVLSFFTQIFNQFVYEPSQLLYNWIMSRFAGPPEARPPSEPSRPVAPSAGPLRRRGNIHRLGEDRTGDDDNNTWNGNSTQQM